MYTDLDLEKEAYRNKVRAICRDGYISTARLSAQCALIKKLQCLTVEQLSAVDNSVNIISEDIRGLRLIK